MLVPLAAPFAKCFNFPPFPKWFPPKLPGKLHHGPAEKLPGAEPSTSLPLQTWPLQLQIQPGGHLKTVTLCLHKTEMQDIMCKIYKTEEQDILFAPDWSILPGNKDRSHSQTLAHAMHCAQHHIREFFLPFCQAGIYFCLYSKNEGSETEQH